MKRQFTQILIAIIFLSIGGCGKEEVIVILPTVGTSTVTGITETTANGGGNVTSAGNGEITQRGVVWSVSSLNNLTTLPKTSDGAGTGTFTSSITNLVPNTTYFVFAYATNSAGTAFGNEVTFKTLPSIVAPTVSTASVTGITTTAAISGGDVTSDGNGEITAKGIVWGTATLPDVSLATKTSNGTGKGAFTSNLSALTPNTSYFVRAYATNSKGTSYGNEVTFKTLSATALATLTTTALTSITQTSAASGGNISSDGNAAITQRGIVWGTATLPTVALTTKTSDGTGTGAFTSNLSGLTANTTYFVRAYATNSVGTAYGNELTFNTTSATALATLTTTALTSITQTSAASGGNISSDGNATITQRGIVWGTATLPTVALTTKTSNGTGTGSFTSNLSGLTASTTYFVRAYATNSVGTAYGNEVTFTTQPSAGSLPAAMISAQWYNVVPTWLYTVDADATGNYIRTGNVFYYYSSANVSLTGGVYTVLATSLSGTAVTFYLKQDTDTNKISISTTSSTSGFADYYKVVGRTVARVTHSGGSFNKTTGTAWVEKDATGAVTFNFTEISRDDWSVYLNDNAGRGQLQIDIYLKNTSWTPTGGTKAGLYALTGWFNN